MFTASGAICLSSQSVRVLMSLRHIVVVEYYVQASGGNSTKQCGNQPTAFALVLFCCIFFFEFAWGHHQWRGGSATATGSEM